MAAGLEAAFTGASKWPNEHTTCFHDGFVMRPHVNLTCRARQHAPSRVDSHNAHAGLARRPSPCGPSPCGHSLTRPREPGRVRSHCRFRKRGTDYVGESGIKWMSGGTISDSATEPSRAPSGALAPPRAAAAAPSCAGAAPPAESNLSITCQQLVSNLNGTVLTAQQPVRCGLAMGNTVIHLQEPRLSLCGVDSGAH